MNQSPKIIKNVMGRTSIHTSNQNNDFEYNQMESSHENDGTYTSDDERASGDSASENEAEQSPNNDLGCGDNYVPGYAPAKPDCATCHNDVKPKSKISIKYYLGGLVSFILAITFSYSTNISNFQQPITIEYLQTNFPLQPINTWEDIDTIIDDVLKIEPIHPAVFLFIYSDGTNHDDMIESVAKFASQKLGVKDEHIVVNEIDYTSPEALADYGYLIHKYKPSLDVQKVMVIKNLHKMSGKVAQALHSFCDEYTPLVDRAVYILTLKVDSFNKNALHTAEKSLYELWSDLKKDVLVALITRVTSTVFRIYDDVL